MPLRTLTLLTLLLLATAARAAHAGPAPASPPPDASAEDAPPLAGADGALWRSTSAAQNAAAVQHALTRRLLYRLQTLRHAERLTALEAAAPADAARLAGLRERLARAARAARQAALSPPRDLGTGCAPELLVLEGAVADGARGPARAEALEDARASARGCGERFRRYATPLAAANAELLAATEAAEAALPPEAPLATPAVAPARPQPLQNPAAARSP